MIFFLIDFFQPDNFQDIKDYDFFFPWIILFWTGGEKEDSMARKFWKRTGIFKG